MTTTKKAMQPFCPSPPLSNAWQTIRLRLCDGFYVLLVRGCCLFYFRLQAAAYYFYLCCQIHSSCHLGYPLAPLCFCYLPDQQQQQQQQTHVLLACFSCCFSCFPRFVAPPLLLRRVLFVCLSLLFVCMCVCLFDCVRGSEDKVAVISRTFCWHLLCRLLLLLFLFLPTCVVDALAGF